MSLVDNTPLELSSHCSSHSDSFQPDFLKKARTGLAADAADLSAKWMLWNPRNQQYEAGDLPRQ